MEIVNVSGLKNNPGEALRKARQDLVVVMNRDLNMGYRSLVPRQ